MTSAAGFQRNGSDVSGSFTFNPADYALTSSNFTNFSNVSLQVSGTNLVLNFTTPVVPEPACVLLLAAAGLGAAARVRRKALAST